MANVIDPAYGVEPIKRSWRLNTNTSMQVIVQAKKEALQEATNTQAEITLWMDGSKLDTEDTGAAVVWFDKKLNKWQKKHRYLGKNKDSFDAELWAISDALELSIKKTRNGNPLMITIFTDSQAAIAKILDPKARTGGDAIRALIYENAHKIKSSGHTLILRWVPSHSKIPGNKKADVSAKDTAQKRGRQTAHASSLTFIKTELRKTKLAELVLWHQIKSQEREATLRGYYVSVVKEGINPVLGKALKKFAMRFYQLKIGHGAVGTFLSRIGLTETPECWWCGAQEPMVLHLYTKCRKWRKERRKLSKRLSQLGISWQPRTERR